jgi:pilus assembly protein CpaE
MNQSLTFAIFGKEPNALKELGSTLAAYERVRLLAGGNQAWQAAQFYAEVVRLRPAAAIILLGADPEQELALISQLAHECPETLLIGAAHNTSPDLILNSLRAGAQEFLRLPVIAAEFEAVLDRAAEFAGRRASAARKLGRVVTVFSNKGGCGTSFLASNLAASLGALGAQTAILDLNLQTGDLGFFFHLDPKFSITNVIENLTRMDDALLTSLLTPYSPYVSLLPAPRDVEAALGVQAEHVREVIELLRKRFDYVVIDLPHTFYEVTLAALDLADEILLAMTMDVMTIRSAQRTLSVFDRLDYSREKVRVVVNRWNRKSLNLDWQQVERFLGKCAVCFLPDDPRAAVHSVNLGQPLVEAHPSAPISVEIRGLAKTISGKSEDGLRPPTVKTPLHRNGHAAPGRVGNGRSYGKKQPPVDGRTWRVRLRSVFSRN